MYIRVILAYFLSWLNFRERRWWQQQKATAVDVVCPPQPHGSGKKKVVVVFYFSFPSSFLVDPLSARCVFESRRLQE